LAAVRTRFEALIAEQEAFLAIMAEGEKVKKNWPNSGELVSARLRRQPLPDASRREELSDDYQRREQTFAELQTKTLSLLAYLGAGKDEHLGRFAERVSQLGLTKYSVEVALGILRGLLSDFDAGMLGQLSERVEAELTGDYLGQAEKLLDEGRTGKDVADRVPAAVLTGAVLENALKLLCKRQTPPVQLIRLDGKPKMLNGLIDDLKSAGVYNELQAKELRAYADIRNAAAHGEFEKFDRAQVEHMIVGVRSFLAKYM